MTFARLVAAAILALTSAASAQDLMLFPPETFGQVVAPQTEALLGDVQVEAQVGAYNNEFISTYGTKSIFARTGRSVGMLQILTNIGHAPCTGFLVEGNKIVTNHHCVPGILDHPRMKAQGATNIVAVQFHLGFVRDGLDDGVATFHVNPVPLETNKELDYTVLQVLGDANAEFGALELSAAVPQDHDPFWVIGHPMGEAQRISREKCQADSPAIAKHRLRHTCDTLPGNSGSPVIDAGSQKVIALHNAGSRAGAVNFAVPMADILAQSRVLKAAEPGTAPVVGKDPETERALAKALQELALLRAEKEAGVQAKPEPAAPATPDPVPDPVPVAEPKSARDILRQSQAQLNALGCDAGTPDGVMGPRSREAFRRFLDATGGVLKVSDLGTARALAAIMARSGTICKAAVAAPKPAAPQTEPPKTAAPTYSMVGSWSWTATCPLGQVTGSSVYRATGGNGFAAAMTSTAGPGATRGTLNGRQYVATETFGLITNSASGTLSSNGRTLSLTVSNGCRVTARRN